MSDLVMATLQQVERAVVDNIPLWPQRFFNVVSAIAVWVFVLFWHYWKTNQRKFSLTGWWEEDKPRFIAGMVVTILIVILKATSKDVDAILEFLGFKVSNTSGVAYGMAIGLFLIGSKVNGKKNGNDHKGSQESSAHQEA